MSRALDHFRNRLSGAARGGQEGLRTESLSGQAEAADLPHRDDIMQRVEAALDAVPADEIANPADFAAARKILRAQGESALNKIGAALPGQLRSSEMVALEAIIIADGTRPSLLVKGGDVDPIHPLAGSWRETIEAARAGQQLRRAVSAVGRIEPDNGSGSNFFGTGWVINSANGLVVTNLHVVEAMVRNLPNRMLRTPTGFRVLGGAYIDFVAEAGTVERNRFRIVEATPSAVDGDGFLRLDIAVLKIEPDAGQQVPAHLVPVADIDGPLGNLASFCVIGFPGPPPFQFGREDGVDWAWVNATLFGGRFGVKRLAPGQVRHPLGSLGDTDPKNWTFGHEATTFGGSSGSAIADWASNFSVFGIHFAGTTVESNYAHALGAEAALPELRRLGLAI